MQARPILLRKSPLERAEYLSHPRDVAAFAQQCRRDGVAAALVFVTGTEGGSVRAPGLRMAVDAAGRTIGFVSNGCVEADIVLQAQEAMASGVPVSIAYGRGSGRIDIALPCGGRIELLIVPVGAAHEAALAALCADDRASGAIALSADGQWTWQALSEPDAAADWRFIVHPRIRLIIAGAGAEALLLARLGVAADMAVELVTPDEALEAAARAIGLPCRMLAGLSSEVALGADAGTAVALMFHDHEWEMRLLADALTGEAFYVGALGSTRAHARRVEALADLGLGPEVAARIRAPIGLVHQLRDPNLLAVSVLAEIAADFQARFTAF